MEPCLNPSIFKTLDLVPENRLSKVFITTPKSKKLLKSKINSKSLSTSKNQPLSRDSATPPHSAKVVIHKGPRFSNKVSPTFFNPAHHPQLIPHTPKTRNIQAEYLLESLIKNRKDFVLPSPNPPRASYKSLKDRLSNTKSNLFQGLSTLSHCISEGLKRQTDSSSAILQKSPIRKWERPKLLIKPHKRGKVSAQFPNKQVFKESFLHNSYIISKILDSCEDEIRKWDIVK